MELVTPESSSDTDSSAELYTSAWAKKLLMKPMKEYPKIKINTSTFAIFKRGYEDLLSRNIVKPLSAPWITWLCNYTPYRKPYKWLCEIDLQYLSDSFNYIGLEEQFENYVKNNFDFPDLEGQLSLYLQALHVITDIDFPPEKKRLDEEHEYQLQEAAKVLYGLIHARYILTSGGLAKMVEKFETTNSDYGNCPRLHCNNQRVLPTGLSDFLGQEAAKLYCPNCMDVYSEQTLFVGLDGAYFGTSFVHMFFMEYPNLRPRPPINKYEPSLFGFKIHPLAYEMQQEAPVPPDSSSKRTYTKRQNRKKCTRNLIRKRYVAPEKIWRAPSLSDFDRDLFARDENK